jgi:diguanylate cyclase (GGDEF)-like protein
MRYFRELLQKRGPEAHIALLFCDLDGFKAVNDLHGHVVGDRILALAAGRLANAVRADDMVARLGGDEFGVLVQSVENVEGAAHMAAQIEHAFNDPFHLDGGQHAIGITVGVGLYPEDGASIEALLDAADARMYDAKHAKQRVSR